MEQPMSPINPATPMAYLPQYLANQYEISRYVFVAALTGFIVDWISSLPQEYQLLRMPIALPTVIYFFSRFGTLSFVLTVMLFQTTAVPDCNALILFTGVAFILAVPVTALLFLLRLRAVFLKNRVIVTIFGVLWLCVLGGAITVPFSVTAAKIGPTNYCIDAEVKPFSSAGPIANTVFSTLVFIAISWRLVTMNLALNGTPRGISFITGQGSSTLSTILLRDGQLYYSVTVLFNLVNIGLILAPTIPAVFHVLINSTNVAVECAMACRVFRHMKLSSRARGGAGAIQGQKNPVQWPLDSDSSSRPPRTGEVYPMDTVPAPVEMFANGQMNIPANFDAKKAAFDRRADDSRV